ncbi:hypothetical protein sr10062 [Sporisorium reilianum SRZ2]|uniref:Uncharacterized protein n=1 Tax=Sporisorium reilianum (strain SRZ2) TaxID=999809 RepID=E6ZS77_SPORE|nr:hypothetical protein sr10062 [Sporisorium reilianum SRZ2]
MRSTRGLPLPRLAQPVLRKQRYVGFPTDAEIDGLRFVVILILLVRSIAGQSATQNIIERHYGRSFCTRPAESCMRVDIQQSLAIERLQWYGNKTLNMHIMRSSFAIAVLLGLLRLCVRVVHTGGGQQSPRLSPLADHNQASSMEDQPLYIYPKILSDAQLNQLWNRLRAHIPSYVSSIEKVTPEPSWKAEGLRNEAFKQMTLYQGDEGVFKLAEANGDHGGKGWIVAFPLRQNGILNFLWPRGNRKETLFALAEVYPLNEHPYIYSLGFGRALPYKNHPVPTDQTAERLAYLFRPAH